MIEAPILRRPDMNVPFELHTDWNAIGLGAVLIQIDNNGKEFVVRMLCETTTGLRGITRRITGDVLLQSGLSRTSGSTFMGVRLI
jgi:hypothetical protein